MKNKNSRKIIIGIIVVLILVLFGIVIANVYVPDQKKPSKKETETKPAIPDKTYDDEKMNTVVKMVKDFNAYLVDETKNNEDFAKLTGQPDNTFMTMVGDDSYENTLDFGDYTDDVMPLISDNVKVRKKYSKNLAQKIKSYYTWEFVGDPLYTEDKSQLMQIIKFKPFSYRLYQRDLDELVNYLLDKSNNDDLSESAETIALFYSAKTKAMQILDKQLDDYECPKTYEISMIYNINGDNITCDNCNEHMNDVQGDYVDELYYRNGVDFYEQHKDERVENIIKKAIKNGTYDSKNPLQIS